MYSKANENVNSRFGMLQNEGFKVPYEILPKKKVPYEKLHIIILSGHAQSNL